MPPLSDKHSIETPEQMPLEFTLAGIGSRFLAVTIDTLIQVGIGIVVVIASIFASGMLAGSGFELSSLWISAAVIAAIFLLSFGYFTIFEIVWNGQTPGKRKVGIRVIKETGRPLTAAETIGRNFLRVVDQLPGFYGIGVLVALLNHKNKRLGDFVAGSLVVREAPFEAVKPLWSDAATVPARPGSAAITLEDLALIEAFLNRRHELTIEVRTRMAREILDRIKSKTPMEMGQQSDESVLEALAYQRRGAGYS